MNDSGTRVSRGPAKPVTPSDLLRELLEGRWLDPESGLPIAVPVRWIAIERSGVKRWLDVFGPCWPKAPLTCPA